MSTPIRVLFVCIGNICRSPMAEAIFRHQVEQAGLSAQIETDSAGTTDYHLGEPPHRGTMAVLRSNTIDYSHRARRIAADDLAGFDYIVSMERDVHDAICRLDRGNNAHCTLLLAELPGNTRLDVPDPYYTGNFEEVFALLTRSCKLLLDRIVREQSLTVGG